jgi:hypothetical protein
MNEELLKTLQTAVEKMTEIAANLERKNDETGNRIERIVAAIESEEQLQARIAELEKVNAELREQIASETAKRAQGGVSARKTLSPVVTALLAKNGVEVDGSVEGAALEAALRSLPVEQRIAVKSQMARAGMIG